MELKEWVTTDAQGLDTRIELSQLVKATTLMRIYLKFNSLGRTERRQTEQYWKRIKVLRFDPTQSLSAGRACITDHVFVKSSRGLY